MTARRVAPAAFTPLRDAVVVQAGTLERRTVILTPSTECDRNRPQVESGQGTELIVFVSPLLESHGFAHGFSTRHGGVSSVPFCSLNLGLCSGFADDEANDERRGREQACIEANVERFLRACGLPGRRGVRVRQVHGNVVADAEDVVGGDGPVDADAVVSRTPGLAAMIRVADCVPVLVASPRVGAGAAIHAGWRGLMAGVIEAAIARMRALGADEADMLAAIGPSIGVDRYEVGDEVAARFVEQGLDDCVRAGPRRPHVDCHRAAKALLERCGVPRRRVDGEPLCTFTNGEDFFSARRDGALGGRLAAAIAPR